MSHPTKCIQTAAIAAIAADVAADSAAKKKKQGTGLGSAMDKGEQAGPTYEEKGKAKAEPDSQPHPESWRLYKANIYKLVDELQTINKEHHQHMINHSMRRKDWSDKYETLQNWAELQEWPEELQTQVVEFTHNSSGGLEAIPEESDNDFKEHGGSSSNGQEMDLNEPLSSTSPTFHSNEQLPNEVVLLTQGQVAMVELLWLIDAKLHRVTSAFRRVASADTGQPPDSVVRFLDSANRVLPSMDSSK